MRVFVYVFVLSFLWLTALTACVQRVPNPDLNVLNGSNYGGDCASTPAPFRCKQ
jgi:hypothetical protein